MRAFLLTIKSNCFSRKRSFNTFRSRMALKFLYSLLTTLPLLSFAQQAQVLQLDSMHVFPGQKKPMPTDFSASCSIQLSADSIFILVNVTDDQLIETESNDRVEVWFALPETEYSDYIVGTKGSQTRIFRNSSEFGDNANLDALLKNSDYPDGQIDFEGKKLNPECPPRASLHEDRVFFGITHFIFDLKSTKGRHADREKYEVLLQQLDALPDDLSGLTNCDVMRNATGYAMRISMPVEALGFARYRAKEFKCCVDVFDSDPNEKNTSALSSTPNRFFARPHYFNAIKSPFPLNINLPYIDSTIVAKTGLSLHVFRSKGRWNAIGFGAGPLIYCEGVVSETGLVEFLAYPISLKYDEIRSIPGKSIGHLTLNYNDLSPFRQEDHYFLVDNEIVVSKGYSYNRERNSEFVNHPFLLPDGEIAFVLYDYEPADPLGWGEYGKMADEFVYIQQIGKNNRQLFSGGQRLEVLHTAAFGESTDLLCEQVKDVEYAWKEKGRVFTAHVKGMQKAYDRKFVFELNSAGEFLPRN